MAAGAVAIGVAVIGLILGQYSLHKLDEGHVGVYYRVRWYL